MIRQAEALLAELPRQGETVLHLISATLDYRLRYWLAQGKLDTAVRWLTEKGITLDTAVSPENQTYHVLLTRILLKQGHLENAQTQLQRMQALVAENESLRLTAEIFMLRALLSQAQGNRDQAAGWLARALRVSEPEGYLRLFVDFGEPMASLLQTAVPHNVTPAYTENLLAAFSKLPASPSSDLLSSLVEPLNDREQQILKLMAAGLSNREIAAELYLSVNTIKAYTSRIYGKLGVNGRAEAINYAHELGIL